MRPAEDLTGKQFWNLIVESRNYEPTRKHGTIWNCTCTLCGNKTTASTQDLKSGKKKSDGCLKFGPKKDYSSLVGQKINKLTILSLVSQTEITCQCECGTIKNFTISNVLSGKSKSCGCFQKEKMRELRIVEHTGERYGRLLVQERSKNDPDKWICLCDCGNSCEIAISSLLSGCTKSCGCYKSETSSKRFMKNMTGLIFGKLTVIKRDGIAGRNYATWLCRCECGNEVVVKGVDLRTGKVSSCGCIKSKGEQETVAILDKLKIKYKREYKFNDLHMKRPLRFDFAIFSENDDLECLIEYQGIQHYKKDNPWNNKTDIEVSDAMKKQYCKTNNIKLFEIKYNENIKAKIKEIITHTSYVNTVPSEQ